MVSMRRSAIVSSFLFGSVWSTDPYSAKNLIRRTGHSLAVIGNNLYVDGGEVAQYISPGKAEQKATRQFNDTLVIPLDQSWSNATVPIKVIPKNAPVFDEAALWVDEAQNAMYMWGGQGPWGNLTKDKTLWGFDAGSQQWSKKTPSNVDVFMNLVRTSLAAHTTCRGTGFYLGGFVSSWTDPTAKPGGGNNFPAPGMLTYDMASGGWANQSTAALNTYGNIVSGSLSCLPTFGTDNKGLVMVLGGEIARPDNYDPNGDGLVSLSNITFWDMETETWHSQLATGDIPSPRSRACVVAASNEKSGSYELFMYGGYDAAANKSMTDVYVLSIPGFVWFKTSVDVGGAPRVGEACTLAGQGSNGGGSRQMIVVGGANQDLPYFNKFRDPDPWANGINVLDLTDLAWKSQYDAGAPPYEPPAMVRDWYNAGNQDKVSWQSDAVMKLFKSDKSGNSTSSAIDNSRRPSSHIGAIVGGAVGGTVAVALLALAFLLVRRRRSRQKWEAAQQQKPAVAASENDPQSAAGAMTSSYKYQPYAPSDSAPGFYEAPNDNTSPMELPTYYEQTAPGTPPRQGTPVVTPHGHSSQQPGRQSHFYEMP
ncbi:carbohydrate esterase family 5 protein [Apiospora arundinis]